MMAAGLEVQTLGRRVGADEGDAVGRAEAVGDPAAGRVVVLAAEREHVAHTCAHQRPRAAARWLSTYSV
jgi:hypothetical protein